MSEIFLLENDLRKIECWKMSQKNHIVGKCPKKNGKLENDLNFGRKRWYQHDTPI